MSSAEPPRRAPARIGSRAPVLLAALLALGAACGNQARARTGFGDDAVEEHIRRLSELLVGCQQGDGSWTGYGGGAEQTLGVTALAVMALSHAGLRADHPAIARGVKYITDTRTGYVYAEGLVPCALELVDPVAHLPRIRHSFGTLVRAQTVGGNWGYYQRSSYYDNSNSQFAVLGLAAAQRCGLPDNDEDRARFEEVKRRAILHWRNSQNADGGWGYRARDTSTFAMTCAGIASLHLLGEQLEKPLPTCGSYLTDQQMQRALGRLGRMLDAGNAGGGHLGSGGYALYALERVGVFLNLRRIGGHDWYRLGAQRILGTRLVAAGGAHSLEAAFHLLFLAKGNAPVAVSKWQWNGDWNNDHGEVREWVAHAGRELDRRLDWWESTLDAPDRPAARASMIFVNGHGRFAATERELEFLRQFLSRKGTVVAEACCARREFLESFRDQMLEKLYPSLKARFAPIRADHPLCSIVHELDPDEIGALEFKASCRTTRLVLLTRDVSCALNGEPCPSAERERARKVATNVLAWAMRSRSPKGKLDRTSIEAEPIETLTADQVLRRQGVLGHACRFGMGRLVHRGEWDVDERFFQSLTAAVAGRGDVPHFDRELYVAPASDDLFHVPFVCMSGHEDPRLEPGEYVSLRSYLQNGGFLFISACCSSDEFDRGVRRLLERTLPNDTLERVPPDDPVWRVPFDLAAAPPQGTRALKKRFSDAWGPILGVRRDGRWAVIYTPVDACCAFEGDLADDVVAYEKPSAVALVVNIMHGAFWP